MPAEGPAHVEVRREGDGWGLFVNGEPYTVRGVGLAVEQPDTQALMEALARHGGNSFRTWHVGSGRYLDAAHALGLKVALCLDVARERHGFDYGDPVAVRKQRERLMIEVEAHKDHPALLFWVIGNELNHDYSDPRVYDAVNEIAEAIRKVDPNHPVTTTTADIDPELAAVIRTRAPALDFVSVQVYGGLFDLPAKLEAMGWNQPIMVTEWGTIGHWEVETTPWGAPVELDSSSKAATYQRGLDEVFPAIGPALIGDFAFLWGQKQERTPTWYGVFFDGRKTEAVDSLERYWTGSAVTDSAPKISGLTLNGGSAEDAVTLTAGTSAPAQVNAVDPEGGALELVWQVMEESTATQSGGDEEYVPNVVAGAVVPDGLGQATVQAPEQPGAYRLFVYAADGQGAVAHANLPFLVEPQE